MWVVFSGVLWDGALFGGGVFVSNPALRWGRLGAVSAAMAMRMARLLSVSVAMKSFVACFFMS